MYIRKFKIYREKCLKLEKEIVYVALIDFRMNFDLIWILFKLIMLFIKLDCKYSLKAILSF